MLQKIIILILCLLPFLTVHAEEKYPITIQKYDQYGSKTVGEFQFKIRNLDTGEYISNNEEEVMKTMDDGLFYSSFTLGYGTYQIENIKYPNNFFQTEDFTTFKIDKDTPLEQGRYVISDSVQISTAQILVTRLGRTLDVNNEIKFTKLKNYQYEIYAEEDIVSTFGEVIYKKDSLIDTIETDDKGEAYSKSIPYGNYYLKELTKENIFLKRGELHHINIPMDLSKNERLHLRQIEIVTDHKPLYLKVIINNEDKIRPEVLEDFNFRLCRKESDECIQYYSLYELDRQTKSVNIDYGNYYLGLFSEDDLLEKYEYEFSKNANLLEVSIDFGKYETQKGEEVILELPKTGSNYWIPIFDENKFGYNTI